MKLIVFATIGVLAATTVLGLWLQAIGVDGGDNSVGEFGIPAALWPFTFPMVGGLISLAIGVLNNKLIARHWRSTKIDKSEMRPALALLFGPTLALLMQTYTGLDHFGLTTKTNLLTTLALLQLLFFFTMGNYSATLAAGSPGGFRTPWTVKSDLVWSKTHRFIGRGLFISSLAGIGALFFFAPRIVIIGHIASIIAVKAAAAVYSYLTWRGETNQHAL